jgi:hypothetical protein
MPTMKKVMNGLWEGPRVRVERDGDLWHTQVRLRDCGEVVGRDTGWYEGHPQGRWFPIGHYRTKERAERASEALAAGTHLFRAPHSTGGGYVPGRIVSWTHAQEELSELLAEREPEEPPRGRFPFSPF